MTTATIRASTGTGFIIHAERESPGRAGATDLQRFAAKIAVSGEPDACWIWATVRNPKQYAHFWIGGRYILAHRVSWMAFNGATIPPGMMVLHRCHNPRCVRPDHLMLGDHAENARQRDERRRRLAAAEKVRRHLDRLGRPVPAEMVLLPESRA